MRIANLEILRFLAAIWVVAAHSAGYLISRGASIPYSEFFKAGGAGVDLFFVLSGFVMTLSVWGGGKKFSEFFIARLLRIVPSYWVITALTAIIVFAAQSTGYSSENYPPITFDWLATSLLFLSLGTPYEGPVVYVGWSLEYEMLFYAAMAFSLFVSKLRLLQLATTASIVLIALFAIPWISSQALEFVLGLVMAIIFRKVKFPQSVNGLLIFFGVVGVFIYLAVQNDLDRWVGLGVPFGLLILGAAGYKSSKSSFWILLGGASYSVYLVQVLTIPLVLYPLVDSLDLQIHPAALLLLVVSITQASGVAFYIFVDKPIRAWGSSLISSRKK